VSEVYTDGGWWPPGNAEPDGEWTFHPARLRLLVDRGEVCGTPMLDVAMVTLDGDRGLVSVPVAAVLRLLADREEEERST
jgi:hypothetical protein